MPTRILIGVGTLSAATLLLEGALLRFLSVAQFYHFAFLVVSLALLGFGASGSLLSASSRLRSWTLDRALTISGLGFTLGVGLAYLAVNYLPFDSYSIAWERRQLAYFAVYFGALAGPFVFSGLAIGASLAKAPGASHHIYAANLLGAGVGALISPLILWLGGVPLAVAASGLAGMMPFWILRPVRTRLILSVGSGLVLSGLIGLNQMGVAPQGMTISPYKGLSYALQYPGSKRTYGRWSDLSRVDVVDQAGVRQFPGLSYTFSGRLPPQAALFVDADSPQPITAELPEQFSAAEALPEAIAFLLRPQADILVVEPAGGLGVLQALSAGGARITAVIGDPHLPSAVSAAMPDWNIYHHAQVEVVREAPRVYLAREGHTFDLVFLPLTDGFRPINSGAYSLGENFTLTVEGVGAMLQALAPEGMLVITRWMQSPPSESVRLVALLAEALETAGDGPPEDALVVFRTIQTVTVLARPEGWTTGELSAIRSFLEDKKFDLVWAPDVDPQEVNRFNRLPEPVEFETLQDLFLAPEREDFFESYLFAVQPPTDDRPFFFHFFRWRQAPDVLATFGKVWQPFGGSGYFVLVAMLVLVLILSLVLILFPILPRISELRQSSSQVSLGPAFFYFGLLGLAFLLIEIPLIQRSILLVGHPLYAFTLVVATLLIFSSLGSLLAGRPRVSGHRLLGLLVLASFITPWLISRLISSTLGWPLGVRAGLVIVSLVPLAILMGVPFPLGLRWLERRSPVLIPWAWAVNGCASVLSAVLSALFSLSYGFTVVLYLGAVGYGLAWLVSLRLGPREESSPR